MQPALHTADKSWTYQHLYDGAEQIRRYVAGRVAPGAHIGIVINNNPLFVMSLFGVLMSECVVVLIPYFSKINEIEAYIAECDISLLITDKVLELNINRLHLDELNITNLHMDQQKLGIRSDGGRAEMPAISAGGEMLAASGMPAVSVMSAISDMSAGSDMAAGSDMSAGSGMSTISDMSAGSDMAAGSDMSAISAVSDRAVKKPFVSANSLALLIPTSGSTGKPKVIMLSHDNIVSSCIAHSQKVGLHDQDCFFISMPLCFSSSITTQLLSCLYTKTPVVLLELPLVTRKLASYFKRYRITCLAGAPTLLTMLYKEYERTGQAFPEVHTYISSAAPLIQATLMQGKQVFPCADFLQTYGQSEASPRISIMDRGDHILSCGKPVDGVTVKIVDEAGETVEQGMNGHIWVKGRNVMMGYYNDKALTGRVLVQGWLNTRDIGYQDKNGNIYIAGRADNIINVGGLKVYPEEVEAIIKEHEHIEECLVCAVAEANKGEAVIAYVSFKAGASLNKQQLFQHCVDKLSNYKIPTQWYEVQKFIKTHTSKLNRNAIAQLAAQKID